MAKFKKLSNQKNTQNFWIKIRNISNTKKISPKVERKNVKILESKNY